MEKGKRGLGLWLLTILLCAAVLVGFTFTDAVAKEKNIKDGVKVAVVYPLSGALARNGNLTVQSVKAAMGWVNDTGGIKSLGGAKMVPVIVDGGSSVEKIASAMERVLRDPDIVAVIGNWASSFTMSGTEISERLGIPQFSISFSDQLHMRGFKWGFYCVAPSASQGKLGLNNVVELGRSAGQQIKTAMIMGDNQAASKGFYEACKKLFPDMGIKIIGEEVWAMGTLTDATPVMQKVKTVNPDIVIFMATAIAEAQMCLMKKKELGVQIPFVGNGGWMADTSYAKVGADVLEGMIGIMPIFENKKTPRDWVERALAQCKKEYSDEAWMGQELSWAWVTVPTLRLVLEKAGSTDPEKMRKAGHELDVSGAPETAFSVKGCIAFQENGRVADKCQGVVLVQWQNGVPRTVFPDDIATAKPIWVTKK
ncbi:MAG: ABC transporter substrate-binding protein [Pseudomonadota bacterium]